MKIKRLLPCILFFTFSCICFAQKGSPDNFEHVLESSVFGKERTVRVFLPERYFRDTVSTFIVTYVLDAQSDEFWNMAKSNIGYMVNSYTVIPMIAVGIVSDDRGSEFNPPATALRKHLRDEVFPLIEQNYRTKDFRIIVGHSWGGAFVGSTLFSDDNDLFHGYVGISPSFGDTDNIITKNADSLLQSNKIFKKSLYLSHGDVGRREIEFGGYVKTVDSLIQKYPNNSLDWTPREIKGTDHWSVVIPSLNDGLMTICRNYFADQKIIEDFAKEEGDLISRIEQFYQEKETAFGFTFRPGAGYLNFIANDFRDLEEHQTALALYLEALKSDENNVRVYLNISDTYDKLGDYTSAKKFMITTLELLNKQKESVSESYYTNVSEWLHKKISSY